jgi:hypothetical protein
MKKHQPLSYPFVNVGCGGESLRLRFDCTPLYMIGIRLLYRPFALPLLVSELLFRINIARTGLDLGFCCRGECWLPDPPNGSGSLYGKLSSN